MNIEIGNKKLSDLTAEDIKQIILIEKCCPSLEFWNEPELLRFDNKKFSNTIVVDYVSYRKEDNLKSCVYTLFFNFEGFRFHYMKDFERGDPNYQPNGKLIKLETLKYLIKQGFDVPIY